MGGEVLIAVVVMMIGGSLLGLAVAVAIKLVGKRKSLPGWPILLFAIVGGIAPAALQL